MSASFWPANESENDFFNNSRVQWVLHPCLYWETTMSDVGAEKFLEFFVNCSWSNLILCGKKMLAGSENLHICNAMQLQFLRYIVGSTVIRRCAIYNVNGEKKHVCEARETTKWVIDFHSQNCYKVMWLHLVKVKYPSERKQYADFNRYVIDPEQQCSSDKRTEH